METSPVKKSKLSVTSLRDAYLSPKYSKSNHNANSNQISQDEPNTTKPSQPNNTTPNHPLLGHGYSNDIIQKIENYIDLSSDNMEEQYETVDLSLSNSYDYLMLPHHKNNTNYSNMARWPIIKKSLSQPILDSYALEVNSALIFSSLFDFLPCLSLISLLLSFRKAYLNTIKETQKYSILFILFSKPKHIHFFRDSLPRFVPRFNNWP